MTPMDYIKENISVTSSRKLLYNCIFNRHKIEYEEDEGDRIMAGKVYILFFINLRLGLSELITNEKS